MSVKQLSDADANALSVGGVTDPQTGVRYPSADADPWLAARTRADARMVALLALCANLRVDEVTGNADAVAVLPGRCTIDDVVMVFAGADPAIDGLANNDTTYIWAQNDGADALEIDSAIDATGWPGADHLKLAEVTLAGGVITQIVDRRIDVIFKV